MEAGYVGGPELDPTAHLRDTVDISCEMVKLCGFVDNKVAVDEDSQQIVMAVSVVHHACNLEFWQGEPASWGPNIHRETPEALSVG